MAYVARNHQIFQNFIKNTKFFIIPCQALGLITFSYNNKNLQLSKVLQFLNIFRMCFLTTMLGYTAYSFVVVTGDKISKTANFLALVSGGVYCYAVWINAILQNRKMIDFFARVVDFDSKIRSFNWTSENYEHNKKKMARRVIVKFLFLLSYILFYGISDTRVTQLHQMVAQQGNFSMLVMNASVCLYTNELVLMLRSRFAILNREIEKIVTYFHGVHTVDKNNQTQKRVADFGKICTLHHHLQKLVKLFNKIFGVTLLLMFGFNFVMITMTLFFTSGELHDPNVNLSNVLYVLMMSVSYVLDSWTICDSCYFAIEEVNKGNSW